jgi:hypothetical protein
MTLQLNEATPLDAPHYDCYDLFVQYIVFIPIIVLDYISIGSLVMELRHLRYFMAVASAQSFTKAAGPCMFRNRHYRCRFVRWNTSWVAACLTASGERCRSLRLESYSAIMRSVRSVSLNGPHNSYGRCMERNEAASWSARSRQ